MNLSSLVLAAVLWIALSLILAASWWVTRTVAVARSRQSEQRRAAVWPWVKQLSCRAGARTGKEASEVLTRHRRRGRRRRIV